MVDISQDGDPSQTAREHGNRHPKTQAHGVDGCELRLSKVKVVDETGLGEFFQMDLSRVESCDLLTGV